MVLLSEEKDRTFTGENKARKKRETEMAGHGDLRGFIGVYTRRRWRPKAGEVEQRQAGGVGILLAALAFVQGGPLSKGNEQSDEQRVEQRERKPEREGMRRGTDKDLAGRLRRWDPGGFGSSASVRAGASEQRQGRGRGGTTRQRPGGAEEAGASWAVRGRAVGA